MTEKHKTLIVILGPTASGKTSIAIEVARHFSTEIISADSRQFFREMNIGVARPSPAELQTVPHHFIAHLSIHDHFSAGMFEHEALGILERIFSQKDVVVCVGGSGLYIKALLEGFDELPHNRDVNNRWHKSFEECGLEFLQKELAEKDPEFFNAVDASNKTRLIRALEIIELTGKKVSELRNSEKAVRPFRVMKIGLDVERDSLYKLIDKRVDHMIESGLVEEARSLFESRQLNALNTVGYKELFEHFSAHCTLAEAITKIKQHTRNYAKRQLTWWRRDEEILWVKPLAGEVIELAEKEILSSSL